MEEVKGFKRQSNVQYYTFELYLPRNLGERRVAGFVMLYPTFDSSFWMMIILF
jgi:hypothetical protein